MRHIKDICEKMAKRLDITLDGFGKERFFLDRIVEREELSGSKLICIAARPGIGKTTLALDFILPEAIETERKILIFSSEKTAEQMVSQFIMKISGINICLMSRGSADSQKKSEFSKILGFVSRLNVYIEDFEEQDDAELSCIETAMADFEDIGLVLLDGLYCFLPDTKDEKFDKKLLSEAIARVKTLSQRCNTSIIITTYMSRADIKKTYNGNMLDNVFFKSGVDLLLILHRASFFSAELANVITDLLLVNKSGNHIKESLCYDTKYRRFLKVAD